MLPITSTSPYVASIQCCLTFKNVKMGGWQESVCVLREKHLDICEKSEDQACSPMNIAQYFTTETVSIRASMHVCLWLVQQVDFVAGNSIS